MQLFFSLVLKYWLSPEHAHETRVPAKVYNFIWHLLLLLLYRFVDGSAVSFPLRLPAERHHLENIDVLFIINVDDMVKYTPTTEEKEG